MRSSMRTINDLLSVEVYSVEALAEKELPTYFELANVDGRPTEEQINEVLNASKIYHYKNGPISLWMPEKPRTKEDFVELFNAVNNSNYYDQFVDVFTYQDVTKEQFSLLLHEFQCDLLAEAAKAGHKEAKENLIYAAVFEKDVIAGGKLDLIRFNCIDNIKIYLPKRFQTVDELRRLAIDLKSGGTGLYYKMDNPDQAEQLSQNLLRIASNMEREQEMILAARTRDSRLAPISEAAEEAPISTQFVITSPDGSDSYEEQPVEELVAITQNLHLNIPSRTQTPASMLSPVSSLYQPSSSNASPVSAEEESASFKTEPVSEDNDRERISQYVMQF